MRIKDVMTPCPHFIDSKASLTDAVKKMQLHAIRHLPVVDNGALVGVLSEHGAQLSEMVCKMSGFCPTVGEVCTGDVYSVHADTSVADVTFEMSESKKDCAIVCDKDENVIGIFTTTDACRLVHLALRGTMLAK